MVRERPEDGREGGRAVGLARSREVAPVRPTCAESVRAFCVGRIRTSEWIAAEQGANGPMVHAGALLSAPEGVTPSPLRRFSLPVYPQERGMRGVVKAFVPGPQLHALSLGEGNV